MLFRFVSHKKLIGIMTSPLGFATLEYYTKREVILKLNITLRGSSGEAFKTNNK